MAEVQAIEVKDSEGGQRLDRWFGRRFPTLSFGAVQKLIRTGQVRVDGKRAKPSDHIEAGQVVRIPPLPQGGLRPDGNNAKPKPPNATKLIATLKSYILYEDDDVLALNKPPGLAVQGGTGIKESLDEMIKVLAGKGQDAPRLVHRLDRETAGVILLAKTLKAANRLTEAFRERETRKIYWAITQGVPKPEAGRIDVSLRKSGERMIVGNGKDAKPAETDYRTLQTSGKAAFVMLWPKTGRTHQLRVHLAHLGTPVAGDRLYGRNQTPEKGAEKGEKVAKGLHLLARRLIMPHPRRGTIDVTAPLPPEFLPAWERYGFDVDTDEDF